MDWKQSATVCRVNAALKSTGKLGIGFGGVCRVNAALKTGASKKKLLK